MSVGCQGEKDLCCQPALASWWNVPKTILAGVDIGGTKTAVVLSSVPPQILERLAFPTRPEQGPGIAIRRIVRSLRTALSSRGLDASDVAAIGISCGSPLDPVLGLIQRPPNLLTWENVPICSILETEFGARCYLENDANAGALAEARFGAAQGTKDCVFLTMGTGLGAGLILNGQLHRGISYAAGEIGHVRLTRHGPRGHGKIGSVEGWASGGGMAQVASTYIRAALARGETTTMTKNTGGVSTDITARDVAESARGGDPVAIAVVKKVGQRLGETMSILIDVLNPECIVVGGLALRFGEDLLLAARETVKRQTLRESAERCRIVPAALGEQIGDVAALCAAMQGLEGKQSQ